MKLVKFEIKEFVPRGKKVKEDDAIETPRYKLQLTDVESNLLKKYFDPAAAREDNWRPSLIAFPHFQAFPSRVHDVAHSTRSILLIDSMQYIMHGLSYNGLVDEETSEERFKVEACEDDELERREAQVENETFHSFLFGLDFTAVDSNGSILILSVPVFPLKQFSPSPTKSSAPQFSDYEDDLVVRSNKLDATKTQVEAGDLSPRLTNLLMTGVVPESPVHNRTSNTEKGYSMTNSHLDASLFQSKNDESTPKQEIRVDNNSFSIEKHKFLQSPLSNKSCSKDWILSCGEKSVSQPKKKLKRLRKLCDFNSAEVGRSSVSPSDHAYDKHGRGGRKLLNDARVFIDDEAEASTEASDDEGADNEEDSYGGSFIDDRVHPTMATTQAETDMMAIYRRSLLTQSPLVDPSPDDISASLDRNGDTSAQSKLVTEIPSTNGPAKRRKLGERGPLPICNLEKEIFIDHEATMTRQMDEFDDDDDEFYQGIDFDALEEEASKLLRSKSSSSNEKLNIQDLEFLGSPSFDLGI